MSIDTLKIGDLIVRQKGPFSTHYIVYIGIKNGIKMVAENQVGFGVRIVPLIEALACNSIKRFEPFGGSEYDRRMVMSRIEPLIGKAYDLVVFNCEHFARWISKGKFESKQVKTTSNIFLVSGLAMLLAKNKVVRAFGLFLIILGGIGHLSQFIKQ
jgi:hypothetical protein